MVVSPVFSVLHFRTRRFAVRALTSHERDQVVIRFSTYELDMRAGELRKQGVRIKLQEQPFLRSRLWSSTSFVDFDHGLNRAINKLREALGDSAESPRLIETLAVETARFAVRPNNNEATVVNEAVAPIPLADAAPRWNKRRRTVISGIVALLAALGLLAILWLARRDRGTARNAH